MHAMVWIQEMTLILIFVFFTTVFGEKTVKNWQKSKIVFFIN